MSIGQVTPSGNLSEREYHERAAALLAQIEACADAWLEQDLVDVDTHRSGGLLELSFPGGSKLIVNTQPPLHEIWLAARGGGFHFRWDGTQWVDTREGTPFVELFSRHATLQAGVSLSLART